MTAKAEFGHKWSLHEISLEPAMGFGYPSAGDCLTFEDVQTRAKLWNSYTKETCPHKIILDGATCGLCGNTYKATEL
jgi:hypothetical protein